MTQSLIPFKDSRFSGVRDSVSRTLNSLTQMASDVFNDRPSYQNTDACHFDKDKTQIMGSVNTPAKRVVYLIDDSYSTSDQCEPGSTKLDVEKEAVILGLTRLARTSPEDQVAVIRFNHRASQLSGFVNVEQGFKKITAAIQGLSSDGNTSFVNALKAALQLMDQGPTTPGDRIIMLTDGHGGCAEWVADKIKAKGIRIETLGFAKSPSEVGEANLKGIASVENGKPLYEYSKNRRELKTTVVQATMKP
jgi:hypothetical protein